MFRLDFCLVLGSSWGRFGTHLGAKIDPKSEGTLSKIGLVFDLVVAWSQDGLKTVPRGHLGGFLGRLGGSWAALGGSWASLKGSWIALGGSWIALVGS